LIMKRSFSFLLLLGALLGLLAQEAAFASAMPMPDTAIAASAMRDECAEMMGIDTSQDKGPCQGLTLDCIAKMGCALPLVVTTPAAPLVVAQRRHDPVEPLAATRLIGRTFGPEPEPPLSLG